MASPALESFCCIVNLTSDPTLSEKADLAQVHNIGLPVTALKAYNILAIISSVIGICGAIYQLWPRIPTNPPRGQREVEAFVRQNNIICYLALADLLAALGIMIRSSLWLAGHIPYKDGTKDFDHIFCAVSSGWIQYFYICTYFWTFCYAIDTNLLAKDKKGYPVVYHCISWGVSALICGGGLIPLYSPDLLRCVHHWKNLVPHFLSTYLSILLVMFANPILYVKASHSVRESLMRHGRYTDAERRILAVVKSKFKLIVLVFYFCWLPNVLNGILLLLRHSVPRSVLLAIWQYMAVVNPVQAFLNCLVYRGTGCCRTFAIQAFVNSPCGNQSHRADNHIQGQQAEMSTERSPLITYRK